MARRESVAISAIADVKRAPHQLQTRLAGPQRQPLKSTGPPSLTSETRPSMRAPGSRRSSPPTATTFCCT